MLPHAAFSSLASQRTHVGDAFSLTLGEMQEELPRI